MLKIYITEPEVKAAAHNTQLQFLFAGLHPKTTACWTQQLQLFGHQEEALDMLGSIQAALHQTDQWKLTLNSQGRAKFSTFSKFAETRCTLGLPPHSAHGIVPARMPSGLGTILYIKELSSDAPGRNSFPVVFLNVNQDSMMLPDHSGA